MFQTLRSQSGEDIKIFSTVEDAHRWLGAEADVRISVTLEALRQRAFDVLREVLLVSLLNGLVYGMLLFMLASGLTLIFSMMGGLNFAHARMYMLGAYFAFSVSRIVGFWPALGDRPRPLRRAGGPPRDVRDRRSPTPGSGGETHAPKAVDSRPGMGPGRYHVPCQVQPMSGATSRSRRRSCPLAAADRPRAAWATAS